MQIAKGAIMAEKRRRVAISIGLTWPGDWRHAMYAGIQGYARETDRWDYIIDESVGSVEPSGSKTSAPYDGVIARGGPKRFATLKSLGIPIVNLSYRRDVADEFPSVFPDYTAAGRLCAEHLIGRGFRRFGCVGPYVAEHPHVAEAWKLILQGFMDVVLETTSGIRFIDPAAEDLLADPKETARANKAINAWLDTMTPPIGLFTMRTTGARQVANACAVRGWRVPEDAGILSAGDDVSLCEHSVPTLSGVHLNCVRIGYEAAQVLDRMMDGEPAPREHILVPPVGIVARASTDFFAVEDKLVADALRFIAANLHRKVDVHDVGEGIGASRSTLARGFRKHVGRSVSEEIRRLRMATAKRLLTEPDKWGLDAIAVKAGFRDATTFCRVFRRELGMSPGQYRKQVLGDSG